MPITGIWGTQTTLGYPYWINKSLKDFGPRFGFVWSPFASGTTTVRSGLGITYMPEDIPVYRNQSVRNTGNAPTFVFLPQAYLWCFRNRLLVESA